MVFLFVVWKNFGCELGQMRCHGGFAHSGFKDVVEFLTTTSLIAFVSFDFSRLRGVCSYLPFWCFVLSKCQKAEVHSHFIEPFSWLSKAADAWPCRGFILIAVISSVATEWFVCLHEWRVAGIWEELKVLIAASEIHKITSEIVSLSWRIPKTIDWSDWLQTRSSIWIACCRPEDRDEWLQIRTGEPGRSAPDHQRKRLPAHATVCDAQWHGWNPGELGGSSVHHPNSACCST